MVMCILSAIAAGSQMIYDAAAAGNSRHMTYDYCPQNYDFDSNWWGYDHKPERCSRVSIHKDSHYQLRDR